jgi:D-alanine-D-alanine ligase
MRVLVMMGGVSPERDVSLDSGAAVLRALQDRGHEVIGLDTGLGGRLSYRSEVALPKAVKPDPPEVREMARENRELVLKNISAESVSDVDVVFVALHGGAGENGEIQALLELTGVPYTGSGVLSSALAMDKVVSKKLFERENIPTPRWLCIRPAIKAILEDAPATIITDIGLPLIVKPADGGSTIGLTLVKVESDLTSAIRDAGELSDRVLVEEYIPGRELTVAILENQPLPVVEIIPSNELYDYECKYISGKSEYVAPAEIDAELSTLLQDYALRAFNVLECGGYARVDFRVTKSGDPYCLEVNTLPGMTSTSLVPMAAAANGMSFEELVEEICSDAIKRRRRI